MLVILNYLDGDCEVIDYERKRLETYLSQQIKSTSDFEKMDFIRIEWGMHHELVIPKGTKVNRFLRNRLDCHVDKDGGVILLPCITLQICEDEEAILKNIDPTQIAFKDIVIFPLKVERQLIRLFEVRKNALYKKRQKNIPKKANRRRRKGKPRG